MAKPIPKWVQERFSLLWKKYDCNEITYDMMKEVLKIDDDNTISVFISELKKAEWINISHDKEDSRRRIYTLKAPNEVMLEIKRDNDK